MFCVYVTPCDYKCRGMCWQPSDFLCLPSHCNLSLPSAEEAFITQSSQTTTSINQDLFLYHCSPKEKRTVNFQMADLAIQNKCTDDSTKVIKDFKDCVACIQLVLYFDIFRDWK